jgi:hypothetical protein
VVLKRDEGESALPVFAKEETKGVKGNLLRTILALGEVLRKEVAGDVGRKDGILIVDNLAADQELNLADEVDPRGWGNVVRGRTGDVTQLERLRSVTHREVHVPEKVALALKTNGRRPVVCDVSLNNLTLSGLRKVRVSLVG